MLNLKQDSSALKKCGCICIGDWKLSYNAEMKLFKYSKLITW